MGALVGSDPRPTLIGLTPNMENNAEEFWDNVREKWPGFFEAVNKHDGAVVSFAAYAELCKIDGWYGGGPRAGRPLTEVSIDNFAQVMLFMQLD